MSMDLRQLDRFDVKLQIEASGCVTWTAAKDRDGYGLFTWSKYKTVRAHRAYFEHVNGPIPKGLELDHICRVRHCVRPDHLRAVTGRENKLAPGSLHWSKRFVEKTHCKNGHPFAGENLYRYKGKREGGRGCRICRYAAVLRHQAKGRTR